MKITENLLEDFFDVRTFQRGKNYFKSGHIVERVKFSGRLWGLVIGSREDPYNVWVSIDENKGIINDCVCSCPVRMMCKHAVALLLSWINERELFTDVSTLTNSLRGRTKEELMDLFENILEEYPKIALDLDFWLLRKGEEQVTLESAKEERDKIERRRAIRLEKLEQNIQQILRGNLDYYRIDGAVSRLEKIRAFGEALEEESNLTEAVEVYFLLISNGLNAFEAGVDDSNGSLGDFVFDCISLFNGCMAKIDDQRFKDLLIPRISAIFLREDYGLETSEMFKELVTKENISRIETELLSLWKEMEQEGAESSSAPLSFPITTFGSMNSYKRRALKELLIELYELVDLPEKALPVVQADMNDFEDYLLTANLYVRLHCFDQAFETLNRARAFASSNWHLRCLSESYLSLFTELRTRGMSNKISIDEALEQGIQFLEYYQGFDLEKRYEEIKELFNALDAHDRLLSLVREKLQGTEVLIQILVLEGDLIGAFEQLKQLPVVDSQLAMDIAKTAKAQKNFELALKFATLALEWDYSFPFDYSEEEIAEDQQIIQLLLRSLSEKELVSVVQKVNDKHLLLFIAEELLMIAPTQVRRVFERDILAYEAEELLPIIKRLVKTEPSDVIALADAWIHKFVVRSHVYYNDIVKMLKLVKQAFHSRKLGRREDDWKSYFSAFTTKYQTRKKLLDKLERANLH